MTAIAGRVSDSSPAAGSVSSAICSRIGDELERADHRRFVSRWPRMHRAAQAAPDDHAPFRNEFRAGIDVAQHHNRPRKLNPGP